MSWYEIKAKAEKGKEAESTAEIYLYGVIGDSWWEESKSATEFMKELNALKDYGQLDVYINSPGGSVRDGLAIYNHLVSFKGNVTTYNDGLAASMASVIFLAGNDRVNRGLYMIHKPLAGAFGNAIDFTKIIDILDKHEELMLGIYESKSAYLKEELATMLADETWLTPEETLEAGLATSIEDELPLSASIVESDAWKAFVNAPKEPRIKNETSGRVPTEIIKSMFERRTNHYA